MAKVTDEAGNAITDEDGHGIYDEAGIAEEITADLTTSGDVDPTLHAKRSLSGSL